MKRVTTILIALSFVATLVICGEVFAQKDTSATQGSAAVMKEIEPTELAEPVEPAEPAEATIPYSAPYDSPDKDTGADEAEVDEDA